MHDASEQVCDKLNELIRKECVFVENKSSFSIKIHFIIMYDCSEEISKWIKKHNYKMIL